MTAPIVELSDEQAEKDARLFLNGLPAVGSWADRDLRLLTAIFLRLYQEGVIAGMDRAIATVKAGHR